MIQQTIKSIELARDALYPNPCDAPEDVRQGWSQLDADEKHELARDYLDELPAIRVKEFLCESFDNHDSLEQMVETLGKRFCKENDEEWVYE